MKKYLGLLIVAVIAIMLVSCESTFTYKIADQKEAQKCYVSNEEYFNGFSDYDIEYRIKSGTIDDVKAFGELQMRDFTDDEKKALEETLADMEKKFKEVKLPSLDITLIKSTQEEECGSGAYTHGTQIYLGQDLMDLLKSDNKEESDYGKCILWHEVFHCLTRNNPKFRKDMYSIIHFTVGKEYKIPASVREKYISNPDVEHHNSHATFKINGKDTECFTALIATQSPKECDSFFECMTAVLVPTDGSDKYYMPDEAENFWEVFGENTDYVIDPEECMADNFSYAMTYGLKGQKYKNPEIIESILKKINANEVC